MEDRMRSTVDGTIVGLISGIALAVILSIWGISPTNSPSDLIFTCLVAGAMVGWVFEDGFRNFSFMGGLMTAFTAMFMMAISALPFALFSTMIGAEPIIVSGEQTTTSATVLLLIAAVIGVIYQKLTSQPARISSPALITQQLSVEN